MAPPVIQSADAERKALLEAAKLMIVAARTAPKTAGKDDISTLIVYGKEKDAIVRKMNEIGRQRKIENFKRDADNVKNSEAVVLIGVLGKKSVGLNCGACGHENCKDFEAAEKSIGNDFVGPSCVFKVLDLGISLGSAAKIASILNVDNRVMYRIGTAAFKLGMMPKATVLMGIPISAMGKSIYFDRGK